MDCLQKKVKHSYHIRFVQTFILRHGNIKSNNDTFIRCGDCVEKTGKCAKCGVKLSLEEFVNLPEPGQSQIEKEEADFQRDLKCLPERRRRAFLRYLQKFNGKSTSIFCFVYLSHVFTAGEIDPETNPEKPREKLTNLLSKFGKDNDDFDLGDDFDDLDLEDEDNFSD